MTEPTWTGGTWQNILLKWKYQCGLPKGHSFMPELTICHWNTLLEISPWHLNWMLAWGPCCLPPPECHVYSICLKTLKDANTQYCQYQDRSLSSLVSCQHLHAHLLLIFSFPESQITNPWKWLLPKFYYSTPYLQCMLLCSLQYKKTINY